MTTLILLRHGETDWNKEHRVMGKNDIPLNNAGKNQAKLLADKLKSKKASVIYSSPLKRALQTAEIVAESQQIQVEALPILEEMDLGLLEGKTKEERIKLFPNFVWEDDTQREKVKAETLQKWQKKFTPFIKKLITKHTDETIVLSTHEWKMKSLLLALNFDKEMLLKHKFKNCACIIIKVNGNKITFAYDKKDVFKQETSLEMLRQKIDVIDSSLLTLLSKRMTIVRKIGKIKQEKNIPPLDKKRWDVVVKTRMEQGEKLGLSKRFILLIWTTIHKQSLQIEENL